MRLIGITEEKVNAMKRLAVDKGLVTELKLMIVFGALAKVETKVSYDDIDGEMEAYVRQIATDVVSGEELIYSSSDGDFYLCGSDYENLSFIDLDVEEISNVN